MGTELLSDGWDFPTSLGLDEAGDLLVAHSGPPWCSARPGGRIWRLRGDIRQRLVVLWCNDASWHRGVLYMFHAGPPARTDPHQGRRARGLRHRPDGVG